MKIPTLTSFSIIMGGLTSTARKRKQNDEKKDGKEEKSVVCN